MATIKELRQKCGLTQQQFASELGKGINTIRRWEAGARLPSDKDIPKIAEVLGCSIKVIDVSPRKTRQPVTAIGKLRMERGLSMQQLATAVDKSANTVRLWEIGGSKPSDKDFPKLAKALGCSVEDIRSLTEQKELNLTAIGKLRIERGLTQKEFAAAVGKSAGTIFGWERGSSRPSEDDFPQIAEVLGCRVEDIWIPPKTAGKRTNQQSAQVAEKKAANKEKSAPYIERRKALGLSQKTLAEKSGVGHCTIKDMESGKSWPIWDTRQKLRRALGMPEERYHTTEERNALFLEFYESDYIEKVISQYYGYLCAYNADLDDLRGELAICALRAIERFDPAEKVNITGFVYANLKGFVKNYVLKMKQAQSLDALWEAGFDFEG